MALISLQHVTKLYPRGTRPALDSINLDINRGEFIFLVGASGSGKTTLLRLMLREEEVTEGEIKVAGNDLRRLSNRQVPHYRRHIGFIFQDYKLLHNKTVWQNVAFALEVIGASRSTIRTLVPKALKTVGLTGKEGNYPHELSGGEAQRVAIARAYVNHPHILLADEPTGNLDPTTSLGIMEVLDAISRTGTTIVMATHNEEIVNSMRKRVVELHNGVIVRDEKHGSYDSALYFPDAEVEQKASTILHNAFNGSTSDAVGEALNGGVRGGNGVSSNNASNSAPSVDGASAHRSLANTAPDEVSPVANADLSSADRAARSQEDNDADHSVIESLIRDESSLFYAINSDVAQATATGGSIAGQPSDAAVEQSHSNVGGLTTGGHSSQQNSKTDQTTNCQTTQADQHSQPVGHKHAADDASLAKSIGLNASDAQSNNTEHGTMLANSAAHNAAYDLGNYSNTDAHSKFRPSSRSATPTGTNDEGSNAHHARLADNQAGDGTHSEGLARLAQSLHSGRTGRYGEVFAPVEETMTWGQGLPLEHYAQEEWDSSYTAQLSQTGPVASDHQDSLHERVPQGPQSAFANQAIPQSQEVTQPHENSDAHEARLTLEVDRAVEVDRMVGVVQTDEIHESEQSQGSQESQEPQQAQLLQESHDESTKHADHIESAAHDADAINANSGEHATHDHDAHQSHLITQHNQHTNDGDDDSFARGEQDEHRPPLPPPPPQPPFAANVSAEENLGEQR